MNPIDDQVGDVLVGGMQREIDEELAVVGPLDLRVAGFLNDDTTPVGSVHFGLVAVAHANEAEVAIRETDKMDGRFVAEGELRRLHAEDPARFETWSAMIVDQLDAVLGSKLRVEQALGARA